MDNLSEKIKQLEDELQQLVKQQNALNLSLYRLSDEISRLKRMSQAEITVTPPAEEKKPTPPPAEVKTFTPQEEDIAHKIASLGTQRPKAVTPSKSFEEQVGGNFASKVGILVTIIGVFIGAKYAIDRDLISPAVRIILGYCSGITLCIIAWRLRKKYESYSAVLMGGGLAVLYFITYIAYGYFGLLSQGVAFSLMLLVTCITVYAAFLYNLVIIAHLGMVGAYAIPFLLSNNSGKYEILFAYIAIINAGILVISFRRNWRSLCYNAFFLTWLIYLFWYIIQYPSPAHLDLAWIFLSVYFLLFYCTFLAYKLVKKDLFGGMDIYLVLCNSFIFYGVGYSLLAGQPATEKWCGLFTVLNAGIHFGVAMIIRAVKLADKAVLYMTGGLSLAFLVIAVPVQFDGNWVTLLWAVQTLLLLWIGRTMQRITYERMAIALGVLTFFSQVLDWGNYYTAADFNIPVFANIHFLSGLVVAVFYGVMIYLNRKKPHGTPLQGKALEATYWNMIVPVIFLLTLYITGHLEIVLWYEKMQDQTNQYVWSDFSLVTQLCYAMGFLYAVAGVNYFKLKNEWLAKPVTIVLLLALFAGASIGLTTLGDIREIYLQDVGMRYHFYHYLLFACMITGMAVLHYWLKPYWEGKTFSNAFSIILHVIALTLLSNEYIHWMSLNGFNNQYKIGLSIIWGIYALLLTMYGIWKKKKHLRLGAISLFIVTLVKLFLYDLTGLNTIAKTIAFISLGVILLLVSYLYNRFKHVILDDDEETAG